METKSLTALVVQLRERFGGTCIKADRAHITNAKEYAELAQELCPKTTNLLRKLAVKWARCSRNTASTLCEASWPVKGQSGTTSDQIEFGNTPYFHKKTKASKD